MVAECSGIRSVLSYRFGMVLLWVTISRMEMRSLLLSQDAEMIDVLQRALGDLGIGVELYSTASWAGEDVREHKFDAVIVDCEVQGATEFLERVRKTSANSHSLTFAIVNSDTGLPAAFQMGANLALQKPITVDRARSSLRAAYGLIMQERRRYFRYPVETSVQISHEERTVIRGTVLNVSEGGMALKSDTELQLNRLVKLKYYLPGIKGELEMKGLVVWKDEMGRAGVRFEALSPTMRQQLSEWLLAQASAL
jgi:DNA-binding response OmpR family regulator